MDAEPSLANFRDTCDRVPISIAARRGPHDIVNLLLERGADPNAPEPDAPRGKALLEAVFHGHTDAAAAGPFSGSGQSTGIPPPGDWKGRIDEEEHGQADEVEKNEVPRPRQKKEG